MEAVPSIGSGRVEPRGHSAREGDTVGVGVDAGDRSIREAVLQRKCFEPGAATDLEDAVDRLRQRRSEATQRVVLLGIYRNEAVAHVTA